MDQSNKYGCRTWSRPVTEAKSLYESFKDLEKQSPEHISILDLLLSLCDTILSIAAVVDQWEGSVQASQDCLATPKGAAVFVGTVVDECTTTRAKGYPRHRAWLAGTGKKGYRRNPVDPG